MPLNTREIIRVISDLSEIRPLRVTIYSSAKGAAITGGSTFVGGLLLGPVGMALGT